MTNTQTNSKTGSCKEGISAAIRKDVFKGMATASNDSRVMAALRHGAGRVPEEEPDAYAAACAFMDDSIIMAGPKKLSIPQRVEYIALTLFAGLGSKFPLPNKDDEDGENKRRKSFGEAMGELSASAKFSEKGMCDAYRDILTATEDREIISALYGAMTLLASNHANFSFDNFAAYELFPLLSPSTREKATLKWWERYEKGRRAAFAKNAA